MRKFLIALAAFIVAALGIVAVPTAAIAHTGNMDVSSVCQDNGTYKVTYTLNYKDGAPDGKAYYRTGTTSFQNWDPSTWDDWKTLGEVTKKSGSLTWTTTLPGNTSVAPWEYTYIKWKDGFIVEGDTRPENLKGNCKPPVNHEWKYTVTCEAVEGDRPNTDSVDSNIRIKNLDTGEVRTFNYHGPDNGPSGPFSYNLRDDYKVPVSWVHFEVQWVQVNGTNFHWEDKLECGKAIPPQPEDDSEKRTVNSKVACESTEVTVTKERRTRSYNYDSENNKWIAGSWSPWVEVSSATRPATLEEVTSDCTPPAPEIEKDTVTGEVTCVIPDFTVRTDHKERIRSYVFDEERQMWIVKYTEWVLVSSEENPANYEECPIPEAPVPLVLHLRTYDQKCGEDFRTTTVTTVTEVWVLNKEMRMWTLGDPLSTTEKIVDKAIVEECPVAVTEPHTVETPKAEIGTPAAAETIETVKPAASNAILPNTGGTSLLALICAFLLIAGGAVAVKLARKRT